MDDEDIRERVNVLLRLVRELQAQGEGLIRLLLDIYDHPRREP
jgi:hypothetical protein